MAQPYDLPLEELRSYCPDLTREPDFDDFWKKSLDLLKSVPMDYELKPMSYPSKDIEVYELVFAGVDNAKISAYFAKPVGNGPFSALASYHGYNWGCSALEDTVLGAFHGYVSAQLCVRGQQGNSEDTIPSPGHSLGWMSKGIESPETYYYRDVYLDAVRLLEILASMDFVNEKKIAVTGGSQGGALSLAAAALSPIPCAAVVFYPYLCNFRRAIDMAQEQPYLELNDYFRRVNTEEAEARALKTLSYFDLMNHAENITCDTVFFAGLVDLITPPSTVFSAYNHLKCKKDIHVYRYFGHENITGANIEKFDILKDYLW